MATLGSKRLREALEDPEEPLLEPCCIRCAKDVLSNLHMCSGWNDGRRTCDRCHNLNRSCDEVPAQLVPELNNLIMARFVYPTTATRADVSPVDKQRQKDFNKDLVRFLRASEKIGISTSEPKKAPQSEFDVALLQLHESRIANKRRRTVASELSGVYGTLNVIAGHLGVLAAAAKPPQTPTETMDIQPPLSPITFTATVPQHWHNTEAGAAEASTNPETQGPRKQASAGDGDGDEGRFGTITKNG